MRTSAKRLRIENLEDRVTPVVFNWFGFGNTLILTQTQTSVGALNITDDGAGTITVDDVGDPPPLTVTTSGFNNLIINLLGTDTAAVTYDLTGPRSGNVTINVNNGAFRTLNIDGDVIAGNLTVTGGNGGLFVSEINNPIEVGGNVTFNGGNSADTLLLPVAGTTVGGHLFLNKFNTVISSADDVVGGNLLFNDFGEGTPNFLSLNDTTVGLDLHYVGGNRSDTIVLSGATIIGRNVIVNLGTQIPALLDSSSVVDSATSLIGGNVVVSGGNLGAETVILSGTVAGNVTLNLGGASGSTNTAILVGTFAGSSFNYFGGVNVDTVVYSPLLGSARARFTAVLGAGNDSVLFGNPATNPASAFIDFGAGADSVLGLINFPFTFLNLP